MYVRGGSRILGRGSEHIQRWISEAGDLGEAIAIGCFLFIAPNHAKMQDLRAYI